VLEQKALEVTNAQMYASTKAVEEVWTTGIFIKVSWGVKGTQYTHV